MSRTLFQTLACFTHSSLYHSPAQLLAYRGRSCSPKRGFISEPDIDSSHADLSPDVLDLFILEDAINRIIVKNSTPYWLPFIPGSSYWVPPRRSLFSKTHIMEKLKNALSDDEVMSLTISRGWPASAYFCASQPLEGDMTSNNVSQPKDKKD